MAAEPQRVAACRVAPAATPMQEWVAACRQAVPQQAVVLQPAPRGAPTPADLRWAAVLQAADPLQAPAAAQATPLPVVLQAQAMPAQAAKAANVKATPHPTAAVLHAPAQNMCVRKALPHHVLLQQA